MKRKTLTTITGAALALAGLLVPGAALAKEIVKMATIAPGSSAYLTMTTMANVVNQNQDEFEIQVDATGAATKHMVEVAQGKLDMSMTSPSVYLLMQKGARMYEKLSNAPELAENLRLVLWFPYGTYHYTVYEDSGIRSFKDIKGKRVFLGPPGGGAWVTARDFVKGVSNYEQGEDFENVKASWSSAFQGFQDRQIDVYVAGCVDPCPQFEQLALTSKIRFLGIGKDDVAGNEALEKFFGVPGRALEAIEAGTYGGQTNETDVYANDSAVGVTVRKDFSDEAVYKITKAFWEGLDKIRAEAPWVKRITPQYAVQAGPMKLHPGALKYYEEIGLDIPADNRP